ncbi:hypothetical protein GGR53DRAFT_518649 [Hypoxylon sp. FL1150]|nr:hypothetical protein GGR53DRAFT_518649 [Hypoxylon sp. FL1150]
MGNHFTIAFITIITEEVLEATREMNKRDVRRAERTHGDPNEQNTDTGTGTPEEKDDDIWAKYEGIEGANGQPLRMGDSSYSYGLHSRNRRILAEIALAADWDVEKARLLERRCIARMVQYNERSGDICWSFLHGDIELEVKEMDPTNLAAVKAAVLDLYPTNSKNDVKNIPVYESGTKRISDDAFPISEADIERAQEELDQRERRRKANRMMFRERDSWVPPGKVKLRIKAFLKAKDMAENDFCRAIGVTEDDFESFMSARKNGLLLESKVYHDALPYMAQENDAEEPSNKRLKQANN